MSASLKYLMASYSFRNTIRAVQVIKNKIPGVVIKPQNHIGSNFKLLSKCLSYYNSNQFFNAALEVIWQLSELMCYD